MKSIDAPSRTSLLGGALAAALLLPSCGGGGGGGTGDPTIWENPAALKVTYVNAARKAEWTRNEPIEFRFSAPLSKASLKPSVIAKAIQIAVVTADGRVPARGAFYFHSERGKEDRTRLFFDPTRSSISEAIGCADNPTGFAGLTTYDITIPGPSGSSNKYLTSTAGKPIVEPYSTFFTTSDRFTREYSQPRYVGVDGQESLGFEPPRLINGAVPYNSRIVLAFDEPMHPASFENGDTIHIVNETRSDQAGRTVLVPGIFVPEICGQVWRFEPSFSFGGEGYDIAVTLTTGLRDLSGNPLSNPQTIRFRTEIKLGEPAAEVLSELFETTDMRDTANTTADWGITNPGNLQGAAVTTTLVNVALTGAGGTRTRVKDHPFARAGTAGVGHDQWIYTQAELGGAGAITSIGWGPSSNILYSANHSNVKVTLGHTQGSSLSLNMLNNFDVGSPVKVVDDSYILPSRSNIGQSQEPPACVPSGPPNNYPCPDPEANGYWPLPTFTNFFEYNGKNNVVLDIDATLGTAYQITRIYFGPVGFPNRHCFAANGLNSATVQEPVVTDMQFTKKVRTSIAQSDFYDSAQGNPDYSTPILSPSIQNGGLSLQVEYEGAEGILSPTPTDPSRVVPNPNTYTGFVTNIDQLDGLRFVRFRATLVANVNTGEVPVLGSLAIPYIFK